MSTKEGSNFVVQALDPFHDFERDLSGYPDINSTGTVLMCVNKEFSITKPSGLASGNWDLHVWSAPVLLCSDVLMAGEPGVAYFYGGAQPGDESDTFNIPNHTLPVKIGPLNWSKVAAGQPTVPVASTFAPTNGEFNALDINDFCDDSRLVRIVGMGFEVHNTTAEIYKQGALTVYEMPNSSQDSSVTITDGVSGNRTDFGVIHKLPPGTIDSAVLLPKSKTWKAAEGSYCIVTQNDMSNPLAPRKYARTVFVGTDDGTGSNPALIQDIQSFDQLSRTVTVNFNTKGSYLTGLSNESTITLKVRMILEIAPTGSDPLVPLMKPSPMLDMEALVAYSKAIRDLPPGTKVENNASGDWFRDVVKTITKHSPSVGALFGPQGEMIGRAVSIVGGAIGKKLDQKDAKKIKQAYNRSIAATRIAGDGKRK